MKIGIIGTGRIGSGLAKHWVKAGHTIMFGSREPEKGRAVAAEIGGSTQGGTQEEAAAFGEVVVLATPWNAAEAVARSLSLSGKVVIDCTNDLSPARAETSRGTAQDVAEWAAGAKVVKAFNTVFFQILHAEQTSDERGTVFIVGDDAEAKSKVGGLIRDAGFEPHDAGGLKNAHHIDNLAAFIVELGYGQGQGTNITYKLLRL
jgi:8-hydroxy-5-deazaflavin:NADPH oxidoreductase